MKRCGCCGGGGVAENAIKVKEEDSCGPALEKDTGDAEDEPTDIRFLEEIDSNSDDYS